LKAPIGFVAGLCLHGIARTVFARKTANTSRYAFRGWLAAILTDSARARQDFPMARLKNPRHERFAVECASMTPVGKAYELAGFRSKPEWCRPNGVKLSRNSAVAARILELRTEFTASCGLSVEYLQAKLLPAAEMNVIDLFDEGDKLKPISKLSRDQGAAIASIKFHDNGEVS
jgi:hypothetical protein